MQTSPICEAKEIGDVCTQAAVRKEGKPGGGRLITGMQSKLSKRKFISGLRTFAPMLVRILTAHTIHATRARHVTPYTPVYKHRQVTILHFAPTKG